MKNKNHTKINKNHISFIKFDLLSFFHHLVFFVFFWFHFFNFFVFVLLDLHVSHVNLSIHE